MGTARSRGSRTVVARNESGRLFDLKRRTVCRLPSVDLLELADKLWSGDLDVAGPPSPEHPGNEKAVNPFVPRGELVEIGQGTAFVNSFANVSASKPPRDWSASTAARPSRQQTSTG